MGPSLFKKYVAVQKKLTESGREMDGVFVPFEGLNYRSASGPRLMIIGKETAGWEKGGYINARNVADNFVTDEVIGGDYHSSFWHYIIDLVPRVFRACGLDAQDTREWALTRIVWNNLIKMGEKGRSPSNPAYYEQLSLANECLKEELEEYRPTCVVSVAQAYESDFAETVSQYCDLNNADQHWHRHPQGWAYDEREYRKKVICEAQAKLWTT